MNKFYLLLLLLITLLVSGCGSFENDPKPVSPSEKTVDINIGRVIRSGEFEQRAETEILPQNNCDNKSSISFSVSRERTLEQSVDLIFQGEGGGELELAGKPMEVGVAGKIIAAIGAEYGQSSRKSISDSGGMQFTIEAGDFPNYTVVWREKWEKGFIIVHYDGEEVEIPYLYLATARPELIGVEYKNCSGEPIQEAESNSSPASTPQLLPTSAVIIRADDVIFKIKGEDGEIQRILSWWREDDQGNQNGQLNPLSLTPDEKCFGMAWNTNNYGYHRLVVFQNPIIVSFADGGWYVKVCVPNDITISPQDIGRIQSDWLGKRYGIDNQPWEVIIN